MGCPGIFDISDRFEKLYLSEVFPYTDQLVDTLLHEALHYCAYFKRPTRKRVWRELSADDEHLAMQELGLD